MLEFIGKGSAFNTQLGNNCAFIKGEDSMILIDCGGDVFHRLKSKGLLNYKRLYIIITHTHPDHVGSLGDLIFYSYYVKNIKPKIFFPHRKTIEDFLSYIGVNNEFYDLESRYIIGFNDEELKRIDIEFLNAKHVREIPAYSFILKKDGERIYYSGDTNEVLSEVITMLENGRIKKVYHEVSSLDLKNSPHTSLKDLCNAFKKEFRDSVYCMHLDEGIKEDELINLGFRNIELF